MGTVTERLERDFFAFQPTVFTVMLGMNDANYSPYNETTYNAFTTGYAQILTSIRRRTPGARGWLIRPSPFDDVTRDPSFPGGYNSVLLTYGNGVAQLAKTNGYRLLDFNKPVTDLLAAAKAVDLAASQELIADRIHPGAGAQYWMAWNLLRAWGATGNVSATTINVDTGRSTGDNAQIKDVRANQTHAEWTSLEGALPFPYDRSDASTRLVLKVTNLDNAQNLQIVSVTGLAAGRYKLFIDGGEVGRFTNLEFRDGVNIGNLTTPMVVQAANVANLTNQRSSIQRSWWRYVLFQYQWLGTDGVRQAVNGLKALEEDLVREQQRAAVPKWHRFEVVKL
jgi:lysophospholipase L1-like esterase